jgi:hypothetical protein
MVGEDDRVLAQLAEAGEVLDILVPLETAEEGEIVLSGSKKPPLPGTG